MAWKKGYGQYCSVAPAAEMLAERWPPRVVWELLYGSHRFNDLRRGSQLMSTSAWQRLTAGEMVHVNIPGMTTSRDAGIDR